MPRACAPSRRPAGRRDSPGPAGALTAFPGREEVPVAELDRLHRLVDHPLQLVVVADLDVAGHREVLAQRMAVEAVVGQDAAQVRVAVEDDAVQVEGLALVPVGGGEDAGDRGHGRVLVGLAPSPGCGGSWSSRAGGRPRRTAAPLRIIGPGQVDELVKRQPGSSRRWVSASTIRSGRRSARSARHRPPGSRSTRRLSWPQCVLPSAVRSSCALAARSSLDGPRAADLLLQLQHAIDQASAVGGQPGT